ncbi:MAG: hypothetical protein WD294_00485 [Phycisphaeraceae bacterium]
MVDSGTRTATVGGAAGERRRWLTGWRVVVFLLVFVFVLLLCVRGAIAWRYSAELEARRAAGLPVDVASFRDWQGEIELGAAEIYAEAFEAMERARWSYEDKEELVIAGSAELPEDGGPLTERQLEIAHDYLADHAEALALLHEAAEAGGGAGPWRLDKGRGVTEFSNLSAVRSGLRLLSLQARIAAEEGDAEAAVAALETGSFVAGMMKQEPFAIDHLVTIACASLCVEVSAELLGRVPLDQAQLRRIGDALERVTPTSDDFLRRLIGEDAYMVLVLDEEGPDALAEYIDGSPMYYRLTGLTELTLMRNWQMMELYLDAFENIEGEPERLDEYRRISNMPYPVWGGLGEESATLTGRVLISHYRALARHRAAAAGLAVMRYRLAEGRLPGELGEVVDEQPLDPFTGDPLIYRVSDDGFVIYSVNDNLVDSGGDDSEDAQDRSEDDVVFRVRLRGE